MPLLWHWGLGLMRVPWQAEHDLLPGDQAGGLGFGGSCWLRPAAKRRDGEHAGCGSPLYGLGNVAKALLNRSSHSLTIVKSS